MTTIDHTTPTLNEPLPYIESIQSKRMGNFVIIQAVFSDIRRRIQAHISRLGSEDMLLVHKAEKRLMRFGKKAIVQLMDVLSSENPQVRLYALYILAKTGEPEMLAIIAPFVHDPDEYVRYDAMMALGYLGDPRAIPILQEVAYHREDPVCVASAACMSLTKFSIQQEPKYAYEKP